jgi:hypothetical protein
LDALGMPCETAAHEPAAGVEIGAAGEFGFSGLALLTSLTYLHLGNQRRRGGTSVAAGLSTGLSNEDDSDDDGGLDDGEVLGALWADDAVGVALAVARMPHLAELHLECHDGGRVDTLALGWCAAPALRALRCWVADGGGIFPQEHDAAGELVPVKLGPTGAPLAMLPPLTWLDVTLATDGTEREGDGGGGGSAAAGCARLSCSCDDISRLTALEVLAVRCSVLGEPDLLVLGWHALDGLAALTRLRELHLEGMDLHDTTLEGVPCPALPAPGGTPHTDCQLAMHTQPDRAHFLCLAAGLGCSAALSRPYHTSPAQTKRNACKNV